MADKNDYQMFCEKILEEMKKRFSQGYQIEIHEVLKNNTLRLDGMTIREENRRISPNFYLGQWYESYQKGASVEKLAEKMEQIYYESMDDSEEIDTNFSYENCKEKIVFRLVSRKWNQMILDTVPHISFLDMEIIFYLVLKEEEDSIGSVRVSHTLRKQWQVEEKSLFQVAMENMRRMFPEKICPMVQLLGEIAGEEEVARYVSEEYGSEGREKLIVITNEKGINGASAILYPDTLKMVSGMVQGDYYLLPSSIHEFLAVSARTSLSEQELQSMVKEVNSTCVAREELLSDQVYYYDASREKIRTCSGK